MACFEAIIVVVVVDFTVVVDFPVVVDIVVVVDYGEIFVFVVVLSQKPSIKNLVKIGSVIDEMLLLLLLFIPQTYLKVKLNSGHEQLRY